MYVHVYICMYVDIYVYVCVHRTIVLVITEAQRKSALAGLNHLAGVPQSSLLNLVWDTVYHPSRAVIRKRTQTQARLRDS